jgi:hypothetical protein
MQDVVEEMKREKRAEELEKYYERESNEFIGRKLADRFWFRQKAREVRYYGSTENVGA